MSLTELALEQVARPLRLRRNTAWIAAALGLAMLLLGVAAWLARLDVIRTLAWVPAAWIGAALLGAAAAWGRRRAAAGLATRSVAEWLERSGAWRLGALRSLLERAQQGSSNELAAAADAASAASVGARASEARAARCSTLTGGSLGSGVARTRRGSSRVLGYASRSRCRPLASGSRLARGRVARAAPRLGRQCGPRCGSHVHRHHLRASRGVALAPFPGRSLAQTPLALDANGAATHVIPKLETDLFARVSSGERGSDTLMVHVRQPVFLASLEVTARYPAYLRLEDEPIPTTGDTVLLPAGTRLETRGEATAELEDASWSAGDAENALPVDGKQFDRDFTPVRSGAAAAGAPHGERHATGGRFIVLPLRIIPDSAPGLEIPVPGADTTASPDARALIVVDAHDDHGLKSVVLELRRVSVSAPPTRCGSRKWHCPVERPTAQY